MQTRADLYETLDYLSYERKLDRLSPKRKRNERGRSGPEAQEIGGALRRPAGNTALCTVGRSGNDLHYRGYDILDFADEAEFEEVAYLLVHEKLPNAGELASYKKKLRALRGMPPAVMKALEPCRLQRIRWT